MTDDLLYIDASDVRRAVAAIDPLAAVHEALVLHACGDAVLAPESYLAWSPAGGERARSLAMPSRLGGDLQAVGIKIMNANPANTERGWPRADGLFVLFDHRTSRPTAVLDAGDLSALRTAAVSALAAQRLAVSSPGTLAVLGAGVLGRVHAEVLADRVPGVNRIVVYDERQARAEALVEVLPPGCKAVVAASAAEALVDAGIVVTATTTTQPYVSLAMLRPGTLVLNVSLDDLDETVLLGADRLYVDDWELIVADEHRLLGRLARAGQVTSPSPHGRNGEQGRRVDGTLGQLLAGLAPGRMQDDEVIVVNPFGMAINDLALARLVHAVCVQRGWGLALERGGRTWT